jgi:hypothetical protein
VTRRGDDKGVLRLAPRLQSWMGIAREPFRFSPSGGLWAALFSCRTFRVSAA